MQTVCATSRVAEPSCSGRRLEQRSANFRLPAQRAHRAGRRQLHMQALLGELDLPSTLLGLQDAALHLHAAASSAASAPPPLAHAAATVAGQLQQHPGGQLQQLLTLADVAVQRIAELADAAVATASSVADGTAAAVGDAVGAAAEPKDNGWLQPLVGGLETVLAFIEDGLKKLGVPYSYGWAIVVMTAAIKLVTFPLTKKQIESGLNMQQLKPTIDKIKAQYGDDKEAISRETSALYAKAGIDPLAGCLPSLATIPIFIGLFRSLSDFASKEEAGSAAFYWIPSLSGPATMAAQKAGAGTAWLYPLIDGAPPIGWDLASRYLALPIALVVMQYISNAIITPPQTDESDTAKFTQNLVKVLPLMIGWFALNVPSGLSLYYFSNTLFTTASQVYLKKLGGASLADYDLGPIELGKARRTGASVEGAPGLDGTASSMSMSEGGEAGAGAALMAVDGSSDSSSVNASMSAGNGALEGAGEAAGAGTALAAMGAGAEAAAVPTINRRCKRRHRELLEASA